MGVGTRKLRDLGSEFFGDIVSDALTQTHRLGRVFYVDSNTGSDSYGGDRIKSPKATIAGAMSVCTASQGDRIIVLPAHTETSTAVITVKAGVRIIGRQCGNLRPVITVNGAIDLFNMTGANSLIQGLELTIASTDAATALINMAAAKCVVRDVKMIPSVTSYNVVDCITIASGADDCLIENVRIINTVVPVNSFVNIEAAIARLQIKGCRFYGDTATGGLIDAAVVATFLELEDNVVATIGTTQPAALLDGNAAPLIAIRNHFLGTSTTIADNTQLGNLARRTGNFTLEATDGSASATQVIPAADVE